MFVSVRARCGTSVEREGERREEEGRVDRGRTLVRRALVDPEGRARGEGGRHGEAMPKASSITAAKGTARRLL